QTTYYPGRSLAVRHEARVRWSDGSRTDESVVVAAGRRPPTAAFTVSDGSQDLVVWRVPHDPWLPGLAPALDPTAMTALLGQIGLTAPQLRCTLRAYRPGRRAVVELSGPGARAFVKIVPTKSVQALHDHHASL